MGQAKRRGTFEERKAQSHDRYVAERDRRTAELKAVHDAYRVAHPNEPIRPSRRPSLIVAHMAMMATIMNSR